MKFRLKAFGLHLLCSASVLALVWAVLFLGWYRWPAWYLTGVLKVAAVMVGVDVVLGPLLTLIIANPSKPRRELARDVGIIVCVQLLALGYGSTTMWNGRVLYYVFSTKWLEIVQASDLSPTQIALARKESPDFAPHWYSLPRWVYAPLPADEATRAKIVTSSITGGDDVIQMPRYFRPWAEGLPELRKQLKAVDTFTEFGVAEKRTLKERMAQLGIPAEQAITMPAMGKGRRLLAVFDPEKMTIRKLIRTD